MRQRIHAIDAIRGACLINILVNHITLGSLNAASPSKIAFCDSADVFVLLSGISAFLAYGARMSDDDIAGATYKIWRRALQIYLVALTVLTLSFFIYFVSDLFADIPPLKRGPVEVFSAVDPLVYIWHAITLQQSVGYSMVLRLYVFLMILAPSYLWLAARRFWYPLIPAALIWIISGHAKLIWHDSLTGELLSMTLLPWQLAFAAGISLGAAIVAKVELPRSKALVAAALVFVVGATLVLVVGPFVSSDIQGWIEARNEEFWTGASKSFQSPLRVLYLFSLAYLFVAFPKAPVFRLLHSAPPHGLLNQFGRNSLEVFAVGAVLAVAIDQVLWIGMAHGFLEHSSLFAISVEALLFVAAVFVMKIVAEFNGSKSSLPAGASVLQRS